MLNWLVPALTIVATYIVGRLENLSSKQHSIENERYRAFYAPYIQLLYVGMLWDMEFSELDFEARSKFLDLISKNVHLVDKDTLKEYPNFYLCYLGMLEFENNNLDFSTAPIELNKAFNNISISVLSHGQTLSTKLHLPNIAEFALKEFLNKNSQLIL